MLYSESEVEVETHDPVTISLSIDVCVCVCACMCGCMCRWFLTQAEHLTLNLSHSGGCWALRVLSIRAGFRAPCVKLS